MGAAQRLIAIRRASSAAAADRLLVHAYARCRVRDRSHYPTEPPPGSHHDHARPALSSLRKPVVAAQPIPALRTRALLRHRTLGICQPPLRSSPTGNGRHLADGRRTGRLFLSEGHYAPIASTLASLAAHLDPGAGPGVAVDLAGGTGYYLCALLDSITSRPGICLDLSKPAPRRAARTHPRVTAVGADVWRRLPLADGSAAIVLSVFGPRNTEEIMRVLARDGIILLVTPAVQHLHEVIGDLGMLSVDAAKPQRLAASLAGLDRVSEQTLTYRVALRHPDLSNLVAMGPSAHHMTAVDLAHRVAALPSSLPVTVSVRVAAYRAAVQ